MKGDVSYDRLDLAKHFNRVLKQQGRVDLDADWNEQAGIWHHLLRTFIIDVVGPHGGPRHNCGFGVLDWAALTDAERQQLTEAGLAPAVGDFLIGAGRYYVDGLLVENDAVVSYQRQPDWRGPKLTTGKKYLAYLDVWERHITWIEDDSIREKALNGPDTCTRVKTTWQVKLLEVGAPHGGSVAGEMKSIDEKLAAARSQLAAEQGKAKPSQTAVKRLQSQIAAMEKQREDLRIEAEAGGGEEEAAGQCAELLKPLLEVERAKLRARLEPGETEDDPCVLPPESRYRGLENHLYRIEVPRGSDNAKGDPPTFKWSRENGSVTTRWLGTEGNEILTASSRGFEAGEWVELTDDVDELQGQPGNLVRLVKVEGNVLTAENPPAWSNTLQNPKVRRWDQQENDELTLDDGAIEIVAGVGDQGWIEIEDGIEVQFTPALCRTGDYWLIPARVVTGDIEWPRSGGQPRAMPPRGIEHHYVPIALIGATATAPFVAIAEDCRCRFASLECLAGE
jgi:Family of unknown function (DUF6519)